MQTQKLSNSCLANFPHLPQYPRHRPTVSTKALLLFTIDQFFSLDNQLFSAEAQAMWAVAFFDGNIKLPSIKNLHMHIAQRVSYIRRRYGSSGSLGNDLSMDTIPYVISLLAEIGVHPKKDKLWRRYRRDSVSTKDLKHTWDEYRRLHGEKAMR